MRRRLHGGHQRSACDLATETAEFFGGNDDDFVAPMHGYVLWPLVADTADKFTEPRLRILQRPMGCLPRAGATGFRPASFR
jgi:hypothetical protein